jgi:hypothetical protein
MFILVTVTKVDLYKNASYLLTKSSTVSDSCAKRKQKIAKSPLFGTKVYRRKKLALTPVYLTKC